jgi:MoaA/NifB/PqqE/SkfB family radical SAM enzyme
MYLPELHQTTIIKTAMSNKDEYWVEVDEEGRLALPAEVAKDYGIRPGSQMVLKHGTKSLRLHRPVTHIAKIYVEPTSCCNLSCRTCIRNAWEEPQGDMSAETWNRVVENVKSLPSRPDVFFGGFGEPLLIPHIAEMVAQVKKVARHVELITNGILLNEQRSRELLAAGLNTLWVSVDGVTPESYADVRIGAALPQVLENIRRISLLRLEIHRKLEIGIAFVAMRRNIADLPALIRMAPSLGISRYLVTNVLPYTEAMCEETLYTRTVDGMDSMPSHYAPQIDLPRMDLNKATHEAIVQSIRYRQNVRWNGVTLGQERGRCPFIERGSLAITWNGDVSPCLALMHSYGTFLNDQQRKVRRSTFGNLSDQDLPSIWLKKDYVSFRHRVAEFDFSPCSLCGGCEMVYSNEEDCFGNTFPTCGGCLWAQGVIQCP